MKKYFLGLVAVVIAVMGVAFTSPSVKVVKKGVPYTSHYFKFVGTRNLQEADVTKWDEITMATYGVTSCSAAHLGCKLITTTVQTVGGFVRPQTVPLIAGTKDPTTGSGVIEAKNFQP